MERFADCVNQYLYDGLEKNGKPHGNGYLFLTDGTIIKAQWDSGNPYECIAVFSSCGCIATMNKNESEDGTSISGFSNINVCKTCAIVNNLINNTQEIASLIKLKIHYLGVVDISISNSKNPEDPALVITVKNQHNLTVHKYR